MTVGDCVVTPKGTGFLAMLSNFKVVAVQLDSGELAYFDVDEIAPAY